MHLLSRFARALRLEANLFEEVEADQSATREALLVVVVASLAAGIGSNGLNLGAVALVVVGFLLGWVVWALLIYWIGTRLLPEPQTRSNPGELLRTLGFAASAGVFLIFGSVPLIGEYVAWIALAWMLVAAIVAVRQALDYTSTARAVAVCAVGWLIHVVAVFLTTIPAR